MLTSLIEGITVKVPGWLVGTGALALYFGALFLMGFGLFSLWFFLKYKGR